MLQKDARSTPTAKGSGTQLFLPPVTEFPLHKSRQNFACGRIRHSTAHKNSTYLLSVSSTSEVHMAAVSVSLMLGNLKAKKSVSRGMTAVQHGTDYPGLSYPWSGLYVASDWL
jgi:hypothetical protein